MEEPVTLIDRNVLKVLSAETRMDILKELSDGERTPSHIAKKLNKSNATIVEHLDVLCKVGLVKKIEQPGKKWVFYTLTERGNGIVSNKSRSLVIILSLSMLCLIGSSFGLFFKYVPIVGVFQAPASAESDVIVRSAPVIYWPEILFVIAMAGFIFYIIKRQIIKR
jgi:DNA-binding transcriptional ArsR family regulator